MCIKIKKQHKNANLYNNLDLYNVLKILMLISLRNSCQQRKSELAHRKLYFFSSCMKYIFSNCLKNQGVKSEFGLDIQSFSTLDPTCLSSFIISMLTLFTVHPCINHVGQCSLNWYLYWHHCIHFPYNWLFNQLFLLHSGKLSSLSIFRPSSIYTHVTHHKQQFRLN